MIGDNYMRILLLNGSPKPARGSHTQVVANRFLAGARSAGAEAQSVHLREKDFAACLWDRCCKIAEQHHPVRNF